MSRVANAMRFIADRGLRSFGREIVARAWESYYERRFGVATSRIALMHDVGVDDPESVDYHAVDYRALLSALGRLSLDYPASVFLDYGVGKGRAVVVAASKPFKRVLGIELSAQLLEEARQNLDCSRHVRCHDVVLHHVNATEFAVPDDVNVIHFYNPFRGRTLQAVIDLIRESYRRSPRVIHIIFFNKSLFEDLIRGQPWVRKVTDWKHPSLTCGIYQTVMPSTDPATPA